MARRSAPQPSLQTSPIHLPTFPAGSQAPHPTCHKRHRLERTSRPSQARTQVLFYGGNKEVQASSLPLPPFPRSLWPPPSPVNSHQAPSAELSSTHSPIPTSLGDTFPKCSQAVRAHRQQGS